MANIFPVQGFGFLSNYNGAFVSSSAQTAMREIAGTNANSIELAPRIFLQTKNYNDVIDHPEKTESDASIAEAVSDAHALGLSVLLKPMLSALDGTTAGSKIVPTDPAEFFASYKAQMLEFAQVAQQAGAGSLSIGNELSSLSGAQYQGYWTDLIDSIRQVYHGQLTYSAATDEAGHVSFWDQLDEIGINAYPPLTSKLDPSVNEMIAAWNNVPKDNYWAAAMDHKSPVDFFHSLATEYGKQIVFTETGYRSLDGTNISAGGWSGSTTPDVKEQADAFDAFFQVWSSVGGNWFKGAEIWNWDTDNLYSPTGYSPMGKPAQSLITDWFGGHIQPPSLTENGSSIADVIDVGSGNDAISGGLGNDVIHGGAGSDTITGGPSAISHLSQSTITVTGYGTVVNDVGAQMQLLVNGEQVGSLVEFHNAADSTEYQTYTFTLHNPDAVTSLDIGFVNDGYDAATGADRNLFIKDVTVNGHDLSIPDAINPSSPGTGNLYGNRAIHFDMSDHQNLFFGDQTDNDLIDGGLGNDVIVGGADADVIHGGAGDDQIVGGAGTATSYSQLYGDDGNDLIKTVSTDNGAFLDGGAGRDQLYGGLSANVMNGGPDADYLSGGGGNDIIHGNDGDDVLKGGSGTDKMYGDNGNDTFQGGSGNEFLYGGAGNDKLTGRAGNDYLSGGLGNDTFIFGPGFGKDVISDFQNTNGERDIVQFDHSTFSDFSSVQSHMAQVSDNVVIAGDANNTIELQNTRLDHLTADDFRFV
ncbi:MAG: carbohydrate-binding domain-containing protein [Xanthobacteraceae bacterium]